MPNIFENLTQHICTNITNKRTNLTACVGIAFFNHKYPIHYGLKLAKGLCTHAKAHSKHLDSTTPPSCLMFHNIQSSTVKSFEAFIKDELILGTNANDEVCLDFGAYFFA